MIRQVYHGFLGLLVLSSVAIAQPTTQPLSDQDPTIAAVKTGANGQRFLELHQRFLDRAKQGNIDLLFLGDSLEATVGVEVDRQRQLWIVCERRGHASVVTDEIRRIRELCRFGERDERLGSGTG